MLYFLRKRLKDLTIFVHTWHTVYATQFPFEWFILKVFLLAFLLSFTCFHAPLYVVVFDDSCNIVSDHSIVACSSSPTSFWLLVIKKAPEKEAINLFILLRSSSEGWLREKDSRSSEIPTRRIFFHLVDKWTEHRRRTSSADCHFWRAIFLWFNWIQIGFDVFIRRWSEWGIHEKNVSMMECFWVFVWLCCVPIVKVQKPFYRKISSKLRATSTTST